MGELFYKNRSYKLRNKYTLVMGVDQQTSKNGEKKEEKHNNHYKKLKCPWSVQKTVATIVQFVSNRILARRPLCLIVQPESHWYKRLVQSLMFLS